MRDTNHAWSSYEVQSYVLECYEGVESFETVHGINRPKRVFMWADRDGEVWIGNSAAFAEHVAERFGFKPKKYDYVNTNSILIAAGERILEKQSRTKRGGPPQKPLRPDKRRAR